MEKYDISIIIPVYNGGKYIGRCIENIINQQFKYIEIIIVNDGSVDDTKKQCEYYEEKYDYVKLINQENKGVSYSRNHGISLAKGKYIMFVDADDYLVENSLHDIQEIIEQQIDIIRFSYSIVEKKNKKDIIFDDKLYDIKDNNRHLIIRNLFEKQNENMVWGQLIKKDILDGILFDENIFYGEDLLFNYELYIKAESILYTSKILYNYEKNNNSITMNAQNNKIIKKIDNIILVFKKMIINNKVEENKIDIEIGFIKNIIPPILLLNSDKDVSKAVIIEQYNNILNCDFFKMIFRDVDVNKLEDYKYVSIYKYMYMHKYVLLYRASKIYILLKNIQNTLKMLH